MDPSGSSLFDKALGCCFCHVLRQRRWHSVPTVCTGSMASSGGPTVAARGAVRTGRSLAFSSVMFQAPLFHHRPWRVASPPLLLLRLATLGYHGRLLLSLRQTDQQAAFCRPHLGHFPSSRWHQQCGHREVHSGKPFTFHSIMLDSRSHLEGIILPHSLFWDLRPPASAHKGVFSALTLWPLGEWGTIPARPCLERWAGHGSERQVWAECSWAACAGLGWLPSNRLLSRPFAVGAERWKPGPEAGRYQPHGVCRFLSRRLLLSQSASKRISLWTYFIAYRLTQGKHMGATYWMPELGQTTCPC